MNILLIPDKFKGSLSAQQVINALKEGITAYDSSYSIQEALVSDGGDGFLNAITKYHSIETIKLTSEDALGREILSDYLFDRRNNTAYIELANTSGLILLEKTKRNPRKTSTYGVGLQIKSAIENGANKLYIGLGGSATNDGGIGIARVFGYDFLDGEEKRLKTIGENLIRIKKIVKPSKYIFEQIRIYAVNDVENPLFGLQGASCIFAKQKGASKEDIEMLDLGLRNLNKQVVKFLGEDNASIEGAGAAGGTAYGLKTFLHANFIKGTDFILEQTGMAEKFAKGTFDLVITGEGMIDDQTMYGKMIKGIALKAKLHSIPVLAVCGKNGLKKYNKHDLCLTDIIEISDTSQSIEYNMRNAYKLIEEAIVNYFNTKFQN